MTKIYDRKTQKYIEEIYYQKNKLAFLYDTCLGRIILKIAINPIISKIGGLYQKSILSKKDVKKIINTCNIDISIYEKKEYKSFNDFFTREIKLEKRPMKKNKNSFISPADSKLLVYKITEDEKINIKGSSYTLEELVKDKIDLSNFKNGLCLVFRLTVDNYHHYCYPDSGKLKEFYKIKGVLHTVSSISKNYKIYKENKREVSIIKTDNFDELVFIEVGALMVGEINNNYHKKFNKGEEKGYFSFGGSTIVVLVKEQILNIDEDIIFNSNKNIETKVEYREKIGTKILKKNNK